MMAALVIFPLQISPRYSSSSGLLPWHMWYILMRCLQRLTPDSWRWVGEEPGAVTVTDRDTEAFPLAALQQACSQTTRDSVRCFCFPGGAGLGGTGVLGSSPGGAAEGDSARPPPPPPRPGPAAAPPARAENRSEAAADGRAALGSLTFLLFRPNLNSFLPIFLFQGEKS